jgi:hypothetical protein
MNTVMKHKVDHNLYENNFDGNMNTEQDKNAEAEMTGESSDEFAPWNE